MDWYDTVFEIIDTRSFSSIWYWLALAVTWSTASHWVLGVPFDMVQRASRSGGQAMVDLEDVARVNVNRILTIFEVSGVWLMGILSAFVTALAVLGFYYWVEVAQAVFFLVAPMCLVGLLSMRTARDLRRDGPRDADLCQRLSRHRLSTQIVGMISVFVTAMWGMFYNFSTGPFGV